MSRNRFSDLSQDLVSSGFPTGNGHRGPSNINQPLQAHRGIYDVTMFQDSEPDTEFLSAESPPRSLGTSEYFSRPPAFQRAAGIEFRPTSQAMRVPQSQPVLPYQEPFFPPPSRHGQVRTSAPIWRQQLMESPLQAGRIIPDMGSPPNVVPAPVDGSVFVGNSGSKPPMSQPSFFDRFKYRSGIAEPNTPVRQPSSSDEFELSSPLAMPPPAPSLQGVPSQPQDLGIHPSSIPSAYPPAPRENPLKALLAKVNRSHVPNNPIDEFDLPSTPSRQTARNSPRQAITLSHAPLMAQGIPLVPIDTLPARYRPIFPYNVFNATQSKCFTAVFNTSDNLVLSAPTGSGKTVVMELAICRLMETFEAGTFKIIYQAPTKALCSERKRDWEQKFAPMGLKCTELTGDTQFNQLAEVKNGDLIVTTPEKWDSVTRRWSDHKKLLGLVRLFLIDEVHILKEDRGATLEVVVSRMKTIGSRVRFIALSATVPNSKDIATWLGRDSERPSIPAHEERLGEEFRPVKLEKIVYGYQANPNDFVFDKFLDGKIYEVIQKHSQRKPVMVFCATRNICVSTAKVLAEKWNGGHREKPWPAPLTTFSLRDKDLHATAKAGVAFHHAGLDGSDRSIIERLFLESHISVICCTSTLAVGVNLPTHLVVIKNTVSWQGCQMREYLDLEVMQMVGRAGRPQFDTTGVAVIMTRKEKKDRYDRMISGTEKLESCLHLNLTEHLNAEIGLGTITDLESAKQWLRSTFFYIRMKANPAFYGFKADMIETELENIVERDIAALEEMGFVEYQQSELKCLEPGDAMARYYIKFETMKNIMELKEKAKTSEILTCISEADEFKEFRIRSGEKAVLKEINNSPNMKWPVKVDISSPFHKANILIQFEIGCMDFPTTEGLQKYRATLLQDKAMIFQQLHRLVRCICDIKVFLRDAVSCRNALELARCIEAKVWENSPSMLLQLEGLGAIGVRKFVNSDIKTIEQLGALEAHRIEMIASRNPPYGAKLKHDISGIPRFRLFTQVTKVQANRRDPVKVNFRVEIGVLNDQTPAKWHGKLLHLYFLVERSDGYLVDFRRMPILKLSSNKDVMVQAELTEPGHKLICHIACEQIVNTYRSIEVEVDVQNSQFPPKMKEGPMSAFLRKRAAVQSQDPETQDVIDLTASQTSIVNKPFKPPTREDSKASAESDEFGGAEFERDLIELGTLGEDIMIDPPPKPSQQLKWTPINETKPIRENDQLLANIKTETVYRDSQGVDDEPEESQPRQRPDGNWDCNHRCSDKTSCRHLCCREGLEHKPKRKPKVAPKRPDSSQMALTAKNLDGTDKGKSRERPAMKEFTQTKPGHSVLRKRVSDLVSAANNSVVTVIDLSNDDDEPAFKGNGADSMRRLNDLHAKSRTNKHDVKPFKPSKLKYEDQCHDTSETVKARASISDELAELLADDDDDFPTISEIMEESRRDEEARKRKKEEEKYGLDDTLLDSLDIYAVDCVDGAVDGDDGSTHDTQGVAPAQSVTSKRKLTTLNGTDFFADTERGGLEAQKIEFGALPSSPPKKKPTEGNLDPSSLSPPNKRAKFDATLQHIGTSTRPSSKHNVPGNPVFMTTSSEPNLAGDRDSSLAEHANPDVGVFQQAIVETDEGKENALEQELMDFLGDCVVFVD
ncbi:ATP-dependent DNA helicase MER3 [Drechslerella dactyloides]|uniref:DNA 3'-5' helicase n=1 Tax=Drechslerella dactyloides TaxID=74499 RepID=A0AAD6IXG8_DREDA|nr:ATP-dependent DNA helicase MER3 [Drechslerella dactyloides]